MAWNVHFTLNIPIQQFVHFLFLHAFSGVRPESRRDNFTDRNRNRLEGVLYEQTKGQGFKEASHNYSDYVSKLQISIRACSLEFTIWHSRQTNIRTGQRIKRVNHIVHTALHRDRDRSRRRRGRRARITTRCRLGLWLFRYRQLWWLVTALCVRVCLRNRGIWAFSVVPKRQVLHSYTCCWLANQIWQPTFCTKNEHTTQHTTQTQQTKQTKQKQQTTAQQTTIEQAQQQQTKTFARVVCVMMPRGQPRIVLLLLCDFCVFTRRTHTRRE